MAHSCTECGMLCHCRGDIDDCQMDGTEAELMCEHCDADEKPCDDDPTEDEDLLPKKTPPPSQMEGFRFSDTTGSSSWL